MSLESFKETLSHSHRQYCGYEQHDAPEFLNYLIGAIHNELKPIMPREVESLYPIGVRLVECTGR